MSTDPNYYMTVEHKKRALDRCVFYALRYVRPDKKRSIQDNFNSLKIELDNLINGAIWAFDNNFFNEGLKIVSVLIRGLNGEGGFLDYQGYHRLSLSLLEKAVVVAEKIDAKNHAVFLTSLGIFYLRLDFSDKALVCFNKALDIEKTLPERLGYIPLLINTGNTYLSISDTKQAIKFYRKALQFSRQNHQSHYESDILGCIANAYFQENRLNNAIKYARQAIDIARTEDIKRSLSRHLLIAGQIYMGMGKYKQSYDYLLEAYSIVQEVQDLLLYIHIVFELGQSSVKRGDLQEALSYFLKARQEAEMIGLQKIIKDSNDYISKINRYINEI